MTTRFAAGFFALTCVLLAGRSLAAADQPPTLTHCDVSLIEEADVPAQEAGVIVDIKVKPGQIVKKGELVATIDDAIPRAEKRKATADHTAAKEKADSDVDIRYAIAAAGVAEYEYKKNLEAYNTVKNSVPWVEVKRLELAWQRAILQKEQADVEHRINKMTVETKAAELDAAEEGIRHRQIKSPLDGVVLEVTPHSGEWVKPGDKILRVVRMDRVRVEGYLNSSKFARQNVRGRPVIVSVALVGQAQPMQVPGRVSFVSPLDEPSGEYKVWAEVDNQQIAGTDDLWVLHPGASAAMTIDTKQAVATSK